MATASDLGSITNYSDTDPRANQNWYRQSFMLPNTYKDEITDQDRIDRIATTAAFNFTDTSLGGHFAINMPPGFTPYADITMGGDQTFQNAPGRTQLTVAQGFGAGRIWHEVINENSQLITMRFGIKAFNSLTSFFSSFYDPRASQLVRTGRAEGLFFNIGKAAGSLFAVPFYPLIAGSTIIKNALNIPATKFSYFKPTMPIYWNAVNTIVNGLTANLGIHTRQLSPSQKAMYVDPNEDGLGIRSDLEAQISALHEFMPDIYTAGGGIDVYAVANRAQRLADQYTANLQSALQDATDEADLRQKLKNAVMNANLVRPQDQYLSPKLTMYLAGKGGNTNILHGPIELMVSEETFNSQFQQATTAGTTDQGQAALQAATQSGATDARPSTPDKPTANTADPQSAASKASSATGTTDDEGSLTNQVTNKFGTWVSEYWESLKADLHDGSDFVTFRTDYGGSIGESFGNSMRESDLQQKINAQSSQARFATYDLAGGNLVGGALGKLAGKVIGSVTEMVSGALAGVQMSGLAALAGAAYVDIPKMYDSSNISLPTQSFTIELRSVYGHKLALLQNLFIPLAMLLAGVLPRSTGPQSYNGPFSCQLFSKGRMQIRDGLITDMTITRGTGNVGFTQEGLPLGIDVSFTVTDFSSIMHMPMMAATGFLDKAIMGAGEALGGTIGALAGDASTGAQLGELAGSAIAQGTYTDDSLFSDYLAILAGLDFKDQLYTFRRWSLTRDRSRLDYESMKSPYKVAGWTAGTWAGRLISGFVRGTDRP